MLLYSTVVLCVVCYLNIQQLYFILQCTICSVLSSICLCMYCTYVHVYHCIVLLHCSSVCNSWTSIVHCVCVLLYCSKYCTSYSILPGTTAPRPCQVFDCEAFMDKFKERFLQSVDSHAIVLRLEIEKVISGKLSHIIKNQYVGDGNEELFLYLRRQADPGSIHKLCDVMVREEGYAMMNKVGKDMARELDLLTGMHVRTCYHIHACVYPFIARLCIFLCTVCYVPFTLHCSIVGGCVYLFPFLFTRSPPDHAHIK